MTAVTIVGRGDDWRECSFNRGDLWGTATCLLTPELSDKPFKKVFAFDGTNFPDIAKSVALAKERQIPVVSTLDFATEQYPLRDVVRTFQSSYLRNSISYMLAYALFLKYDHIFVYGIGGRKRWDYDQNKPYIFFWLGVAAGRGVDWRVGRGSSRWLYDITKESLAKLTAEETAKWHAS